MAPEPGRLELSVLRACEELVRRQQELVPQLAETLGVAPTEVFYAWMGRQFPGVRRPPGEEWRLQVGAIEGTGWEYFFHGFECDLKHGDGRRLRIEFGPRGRCDVFSAFSVLELVQNSQPPWPRFHDLQAFLSEEGSSGSTPADPYRRLLEVWGRLQTAGCFEPAASDLCALVEAYTTIQPDGRRAVHLPNDVPERVRMDAEVCDRLVLSDLALHVLAAPTSRGDEPTPAGDG